MAEIREPSSDKMNELGAEIVNMVLKMIMEGVKGPFSAFGKKYFLVGNALAWTRTK